MFLFTNCTKNRVAGLSILLLLCFVLPQTTSGMGLDFGTTDPDPIPVVEPVITVGPLGAPVRVASYSKKWLLVSDYNSGNIYFVNKTDPDRIRKVFTVQGRPLAVGRLGRMIIVGNETTGFWEVYNHKGRLRYRLNKEAIERPSDLAVDQRSRKIFVVDSRARVIKIYKKRRLLAEFGSELLTNPVGIALNSEDKLVYVSDHGDSMAGIEPSVYVFSYDGQLVEQFSGTDYGFYRPRGLAYAAGKLYVTDALAGQVAVIDLQLNTALGTVGTYGSEPGQLVQPQDVAVDQDATFVYVANKRLGRVEKIAADEVNQ